MRKRVWSALIALGLVVSAWTGAAVAQTGPPPPVKVSLSLLDQENNPTDQRVFLSGEAIRVGIYLQNAGQEEIVASENFVRKYFHLNLHFTGAPRCPPQRGEPAGRLHRTADPNFHTPGRTTPGRHHTRV